MSQQKGEEAADRFDAWRRSNDLPYFRAIANEQRTALIRTIIMKECGIDRSALRQNSKIKDGLHELENWLREEKVLISTTAPPKKNIDGSSVLPKREKGQMQAAIDAERLSKLEKELAAKNAELDQLRPLKAEILSLKRKLREEVERRIRYEALEAVLHETGRLPR